MNAPTERNLKLFEFIITKDKEMLKQLSKTKKNSCFIKDSNVTIVVICDELSEFWQQDLGAVIQNMLLESKHLNIGSCWIEIVPNVQYETYISKLLGVPNEKRI